MANAASSNKPKQDHGMVQAIGLGLLMLLVYELARNRVSEKVFIIAAISVSLLWAIISTFRVQLSQKRFWPIVAIVFIFHFGVMWGMVTWAPSIELSTVLLIIIPEGFAIFLFLQWALSKAHP
jgi:hypothetical protein